MTPKRIGLIGFAGVAGVDLAGPAQAFSCVEIDGSGGLGVAGYEVLTIAESCTPFAADCGLMLKPHAAFKNAPSFDTIVIPGGSALRHPKVNQPIANFVRERAPETRRIVALCTGVYGLAASGLLGGRRITTHWRYIRDLAARFPTLRIEEDSLFVKDDKFYTSAGAAAGIDLALSLIEEDYGQSVSLAVARELVVYLKRPGDQEQYSEPLQFQATAISRLSDLTIWIVSHLQQNLSVETLAAKACLCPRQFGRRFKAEVGSTPADFVENARLEEARRRLCATDATVETIAASVGFQSVDVFRRRFECKTGIAPTEFRRRFNKATATRFSTARNAVRRNLAAA
jgi:transcriptional regulator GlxA family with amidase domain